MVQATTIAVSEAEHSLGLLIVVILLALGSGSVAV